MHRQFLSLAIVTFGLLSSLLFAQHKHPRQGIMSIRFAPLQAINGQYPLHLELCMPARLTIGFMAGLTSGNFAQRALFRAVPSLDPPVVVNDSLMADIRQRPQTDLMMGTCLNYYFERSKARLTGHYATVTLQFSRESRLAYHVSVEEKGIAEDVRWWGDTRTMVKLGAGMGSQWRPWKGKPWVLNLLGVAGVKQVERRKLFGYWSPTSWIDNGVHIDSRNRVLVRPYLNLQASFGVIL